ncbi:MAG: flexitail domain-containing putative surface protein [Dehalococcoidia bacterium]
MRLPWSAVSILAMLVVTGLTSTGSVHAAGSYNTIALPASGASRELELDSSGNPIVAYLGSDGHLGLLHCDDPACMPGGDSIEILAPMLDSEHAVSMVIDAVGNPVIAFRDPTTVRLVHCNDEDCSGGDEVITTPDLDEAGSHSLVLDAAGNPVMSYEASGNLRLLHCNDPACSDGDESIATLADTSPVHTSLQLDQDGNPVVAFVRINSIVDGTLLVLHCDEPDCEGGGENIESPDPLVTTPRHPSLALDTTWNPVIAYENTLADEIKLLHCNDPDCADSNDSITTLESAYYSIWYPSLRLDEAGLPVLTYWNLGSGPGAGLTLLRCDDPLCTGANESIASPEPQGNGRPSLTLDAFGNAVVAYEDDYWGGAGSVRVLHCGTPGCEPDTDADQCNDAYELFTTPGSEATGGLRDPLNPYDFYDTDGNRVIDLFIDIFNVANAFGDDADSDPPGEPDGYDATLDRSAAPMGMDVWDMGPPDGTIDLFTDIFGVAYQYGHDCST